MKSDELQTMLRDVAAVDCHLKVQNLASGGMGIAVGRGSLMLGVRLDEDKVRFATLVPLLRQCRELVGLLVAELNRWSPAGTWVYSESQHRLNYTAQSPINRQSPKLRKTLASLLKLHLRIVHTSGGMIGSTMGRGKLPDPKRLKKAWGWSQAVSESLPEGERVAEAEWAAALSALGFEVPRKEPPGVDSEDLPF